MALGGAQHGAHGLVQLGPHHPRVRHRDLESPRLTDAPVGASLLAKNVNDNACLLNERGACEFFASKLAPTEGCGAGS
ncbi:hypothetical protein METHPM2_90067 [Pseudomonas sp. PM2]